MITTTTKSGPRRAKANDRRNRHSAKLAQLTEKMLSPTGRWPEPSYSIIDDNSLQIVILKFVDKCGREVKPRRAVERSMGNGFAAGFNRLNEAAGVKCEIAAEFAVTPAIEAAAD